MTEYQVLAWRGIPAQARVSAAGKRISGQLPPRYQEEIDRVAMEEGLYDRTTTWSIGSGGRASSAPATRNRCSTPWWPNWSPTGTASYSAPPARLISAGAG